MKREMAKASTKASVPGADEADGFTRFDGEGNIAENRMPRLILERNITKLNGAGCPCQAPAVWIVLDVR